MARGPVCCAPDDTTDHVAHLMKSNKIGPVPVVEKNKVIEIVGLIAQADVAMKVAEPETVARMVKEISRSGRR